MWLFSRWLGMMYDGPELEPSTVLGFCVGVGAGEAARAFSGKPAKIPVGMFAGTPGRPPREAVNAS